MAANFGRYFLFILRREKIMSSVWIVSLVFFSALLAAVYPGLFPSEAALQSMAVTMNTPAMVALMGPVYGLEELTPAIAMAQECLIWFALAVIIMNIFFISRHTRLDEELGRFEMLVSLPVGRLTNSVSAIVSAFLINLIIAVLIALSCIVIPMDGSTVAGGLAYGLSVGMQGFVFAAVALLAAQLFSTGRSCVGVSFAVMGVSYVMRAQGDVAGSVLSVLSPMGWGLQVEAFYGNDFGPVIGLFIEGVIITAIALIINLRRDIGMGVFPARKGRARASRFLLSPFGLAWRLSRGSFLAWAAGILMIGLTYGAVVGELERFVEGNDIMKRMVEGGNAAASLVDAFIAMLNNIMSILIAIPLVNTVHRLVAEEKRGRMEPVLAAAVPRHRMFGSYIIIALMESVVFSILGAIGLYLTSASTGLVTLEVLMKAALFYLPALFVMIALSALLAGWVPRFSAAIWAVFAYSFLMLYFGRILDAPEYMIKITPFGHIPQIPVQEISVMPPAILCILAIILIAAGFLGYQRRDSGR